MEKSYPKLNLSKKQQIEPIKLKVRGGPQSCGNGISVSPHGDRFQVQFLGSTFEKPLKGAFPPRPLFFVAFARGALEQESYTIYYGMPPRPRDEGRRSPEPCACGQQLVIEILFQ